MKKCLFTVLLAAFAATLSSAQAESTLRLINNTSKAIYVAYAVYEEDGGWTTDGWFKVESYDEREIDLDDYEGNVYIHGHNSTGNWGKDIYLCTGGSSGFTVRNADKIRCEYSRRFSQTRISKGETKIWTFNP